MKSFIPPAMVPYVRILLGAVAVIFMATLTLTLLVLIVPAWSGRAVHWYLVFVSAVAIAAALRAMTTRYPVLWISSSEQGTAPAAPPDELPERPRALYRLVSRAGWDGAGFELELRPVLRAIAAQRLATWCTIDLDTQPEQARAVLGEPLWTLLLPIDLKFARGAPGVDLATLRAAVTTLEELHVVPHA